MSDIEDQAAERVENAKRINAEVAKRLKQPLVHGVRGARKAAKA